MKKFSPFILSFALTSVCFAQVADDFSDGDFTNTPTWLGSTGQFIVNAGKQLQLNNTLAGQSYLSTAFSTANLDNYEWQIYVKQSFAPSGSNYGRVYLVSDQVDLTQPLNGYYLQFGEALSNDAIELFKQTGNTAVSVCRGTNASIAASFVVSVKVTRDNSGLWTLYADYSGGTNFLLEASGTDATISTSSFFGVRCTYTSTNATKFYYDDISIVPGTPTDTTPPVVVSVQADSKNTVSVVFSETVEQSSAEMLGNYTANNSIGNPASVALQPDRKSVLLSFSNDFVNGAENQLSIVNVQDLTQNAMVHEMFPFMFFQAVPSNPKDIILTEIFADPSPQVALPAQEFVEIHNRSTNPFDLAGWKLSDGTSTVTFAKRIILPNQYWIVCASSNDNLFTGFGNVIGVSNFPTLNNDGDNLTLRDPSGKTIDSVKYDLSWYHDSDKQEGGWTLEIIDVNNTCGEGENWTASEDISGGTPGRQNSVFANKPDLTGPQLIAVTPISASVLNLTFDEKLEKDISAVSFQLTPTLPIAKSYFFDQSLKEIRLELSEPIAIRTAYNVQVRNLTDCAGNFVQEDFSELSFALPEPADSLDLLINEILFNPRPGGVDFVEVYNNSPKYLNLKNWRLANFESDSVFNQKTITTRDFILPPSMYWVFTSDPAMLSLQYMQSNQKALFKSTLPSLSDDEGSIALINDQNLLIDHFRYNEKMHSILLKDKEGVSLERITFSQATNDVNNWRSANASAGYATPGFINSNSRSESTFSDNAVIVEPEIFSPSVPGKDFSRINYKFEQGGMAANVKILDAQGRLIKTLANNETLALEGFFRWDGDRDDGTWSRIGYYIVWFEVFDANGYTTLYRKRAVIGK